MVTFINKQVGISFRKASSSAHKSTLTLFNSIDRWLSCKTVLGRGNGMEWRGKEKQGKEKTKV